MKSFRDGGVVGVGVVSTKSRVAIPSMNLHSCKPPLPRLNSRYLRVITRMIFFTQRISVLDHSEASPLYPVYMVSSYALYPPYLVAA